MTIQMHNLKPAGGSRKKSKRVGRGNASGKGTTAGRGTKGQGARTGGRNRRKMRGFRQIMLATPKLRGFKSNRPKPETVSLAAVVKSFGANDPVTPKALLQKDMVTSLRFGVKILGGTKTKLKKKLIVTGCAVTASVKKAIEEAGGEVK
ncbi:MAG: 50S ribosomal protein L15 [Patescibacteria group bacterium]|nr:50S ribosomal protein L15 [Patescibacteria group bacterium]